MSSARNGELRILSHNVWCGPVHNRDLHLSEIFFRYMPDVLGLQEMTPNLYKSRLIPLLSEEYELLTHKEAEGRTDNTPLLLRKGLFDVVEHGWHLYRGLNNHETKSLSWAVLRRRSDSLLFGVVSTHFWWKRGPESELARMEDVDQMMAFVNYIRVKYDAPVVAMGDLNCKIGSLPYQRLLACGGLDARAVATDFASLKNTHHPYAVYNEESGEYEGGPAPVGSRMDAIDHIFVFGDTVRVRELCVVIDRDALDASDHCPIYIDCDIKAAQPRPTEPTTDFIHKEK